ncbi:MAG: hypothetical protein U5K69_18910 [Balneolaceae bacterium]|nr:hypothetical protein [Balneolaceae bacterium]
MTEQRPVIARPFVSEANRGAAISRKQVTKEQGRPAAPDHEITTSPEKPPGFS